MNLRPLGNAIIAKKIEIKKRGALHVIDRQVIETPAQLCEIVALPELKYPLGDTRSELTALQSGIFSQLIVGAYVYVRFRGYVLDELEDGTELSAIALEDVLAIVAETIT